MAQIPKLTKKEYKNIIEESLKKFVCTYCGKNFKSTSGRSLHLKSCKVMVQSKEDMALCAIGDEASIKGKSKQVMHIEDGLAVLSDGNIIPVSEVNSVRAHYAKKEAAKQNSSRAMIADVGWPPVYEDISTFEKWVQNTIGRCIRRNQPLKSIPSYVSTLFRLNSFTKYKGWNVEWPDKDKLEKYIEKEVKALKKSKA